MNYQRKLQELLLQIPKGKMTSYKALGQAEEICRLKADCISVKKGKVVGFAERFHRF